MNGEFSGKSAVITGAARGIGLATASALAARGASVALVDIDSDGALKAAESIGPNALGIPCDVSRADAVEAMIEAVTARFGGIDILVNNAGICERVLIEELTEEQWDRTLAVNLKGPFLVCRSALKHRRLRGGGRIINIASIAGKIGGLMVGLHYTASKGGLIAFTKGLAREAAPHGITVNAVCPAMVDTEMGQAFAPDEKSSYLRGVPLARLATPDDVAGAVVYLASDAASYVTGEVLDVNGGLLMD